MNIQSLSIVVPTGHCWNNCFYCVSRMHCEDYGLKLSNGILTSSYINRIKYVRDNGCNIMMLTGTAEPQQNMPFIRNLLGINNKLDRPFYNIEIQTTGSGMKDEDIAELNALGVTTLALSISSFDIEKNQAIIRMPEAKKNSYYDLIESAHNVGMNVRACLNLSDDFNRFEPGQYFKWAKGYGIEQLTFRKLYYLDMPFCDQRTWVANHQLEEIKFHRILEYIKQNGTPIARLPFGYIQYSLGGVSTLVDDNCMSKNEIDNFKYMILRPNGHLYSRWDDKGSLVF